MSETGIRPINRTALVVALILFVVAIVTFWDASHMRIQATYGMGANAASYFVGALFVLLGLGHIVVAFKPNDTEADVADWAAVGWVSAALIGLIASVWLGGGFIIGSTLLFALTARAFGRRAIIADLAIGFVLGVLIFLLFNKLLTLSLPMGPLERLI